MLSITDYKRVSAGGAHGIKVQFKISPLEKGRSYIIYQNVKSTLNSISKDGEKDLYRAEYCEAWVYQNRRKVQDFFLVPPEWRWKLDGRQEIRCEAWVEEGKVDSSFKTGRVGREPWGLLRGKWGFRKPGKGSKKRHVILNWSNWNMKKRKEMSSGKDLDIIYKQF